MSETFRAGLIRVRLRALSWPSSFFAGSRQTPSKLTLLQKVVSGPAWRATQARKLQLRVWGLYKGIDIVASRVFIAGAGT